MSDFPDGSDDRQIVQAIQLELAACAAFGKAKFTEQVEPQLGRQSKLQRGASSIGVNIKKEFPPQPQFNSIYI